MPKILEVIVTSAQEAIEAEAGGADRLELVRDLSQGGLTPETGVAEAVFRSISIPVRVMLRRNGSMSTGGPHELHALEAEAASFSQLPLDGFVTGFLNDGAIDSAAVQKLLAAAPNTCFTFHRAFDEVDDPVASLKQLARFPQIDRILTAGGRGDWAERKERLLAWQRTAGSSMRVLVAAGLCREVIAGLRDSPELEEVHVGRAARVENSISGRVTREAVRSLKSMLR